MQVTSLVDIAPERLLIAGIGAGFLTPATDISALEDGALLTVSESDASAISPPAPAPTVATPTPGGKVYGFLPADLQLLAPNGGTAAAAALTSSKVLGLYFSAHWCPPCRGFTPKLAESYRKIKSAHGNAFEIVYVSSDRNEQDFAQYFADMPWLAVPYHLRDLQTALGHMFGVSGIPALILLDGATGELITKNGRDVISKDPVGQQFPWAWAREGAGGMRAGGGITLADLQRALVQNNPEEAARARQHAEQQQAIAEMQGRLHSGAQHVLIYEDKAVQAQALSRIPVDDIKKKAIDSPGNLGSRDAVARHLLAWFKGYFSWVNNASCEHCAAPDNTNTVNAGADRPTAQEKALGAGVVEVYKCQRCLKTTRFPRYNHPGKLMETRKGRCGEWANAFTLCCIAMGFEARHVVDWTDHVWTEVYSEDQERWIHCDPCENSWDSPLLYSEGWGKKLTYVVAFSKEEIVDVTCRYTRQWDQCKARRTKCPELWLSEMIASMRMSRLSSFPRARQELLEQRAARERIELEPRNHVKPADPVQAQAEPVLPGRTTGSVEWRAARGEIGNGPVTDADVLQPSAAGAVGGPVVKSCFYGGTHPDSEGFDDSGEVNAQLQQQHVRVCAVTVWAGEGDSGLVHGIQLHYSQKDGNKSSKFHGPAHVAKDPATLPPPRTIDLSEDERIYTIGGRAGALIDRLEIGIRSRDGERLEVFGGAGGSPFSCPLERGHELVGLAGAIGGHLHSIAILTAPAPAEAAAQGEAAAGGKGAAAGADDPKSRGQSRCGTAAGMADGLAASAGPVLTQEEHKLRLQKLIRCVSHSIVCTRARRQRLSRSCRLLSTLTHPQAAISSLKSRRRAVRWAMPTRPRQKLSPGRKSGSRFTTPTRTCRREAMQ